MFSELKLSDGITTLDLMGANKGGRGIALARYTPGRITLKGGGIWQDSPIARGRRLVYGAPGNVNDAIELKIAYPSYQEIISQCQALDLLLEKAAAYWTTDWQDEPVYLIARAAGETARRYAVVHYASYGEYPDPYREPYLGTGRRYAMDGIIIGLERTVWQNNLPGVGTALTISHDDDSGATVFIGNSFTTGLTQIRSYRNVPTEVWSSNLISATLPYDLLDQDGLDAWNGGSDEVSCYFGSPYPFAGLAFDIESAGNAMILEWQISDGGGDFQDVLDIASGDPAYLRDETESFTQTGPNVVQWYDTTANWKTQDLNGYGEMYWARVTLVGTDAGTLLTASQQNQAPYALKTPYIEVPATAISGDIGALGLLRAETYSRVNDETTLRQDLMVGLRSLIRNGVDCSDFTAYINVRSADNPGGVAIDLPATSSHTNLATTEAGPSTGDSPTNYYIRYLGDDDDELDEMFRVSLDTSVARQYYGRYRLFVKFSGADVLAGNAKLRVRVKFANAATEYVGPILQPTAAAFNQGSVYLGDLGYIQIPPSSSVRASDLLGTIAIVIDGECDTGQSIFVYEIVLLPVDEWSTDANGTTTDETGDFAVDIDSISYPKHPLRAVLRDPANNNIIDSFQLIGNQPLTLPTAAAFRLWFLQKNVDAHYGMSAKVSLQMTQRYHHLRGD